MKFTVTAHIMNIPVENKVNPHKKFPILSVSHVAQGSLLVQHRRTQTHNTLIEIREHVKEW
jgi:hypothetical protein